MAELTDWTCEYNGLVMGADDSAISIVSVDGLLSLPDIRSADLTLVQRHGLYPVDDYMNGRAITLTLEVYGSTREEFTAALLDIQSAFMPAQVEKPLRFLFPGVAADREAFVMARPRKRSAPLDLNFANMVCNVVVELFATSPYLVGSTPRTSWIYSLVTEAPTEGAKVPLSVPFDVKASDVADPGKLVTQYGSVPALPRIEIRDASNPTLYDDTTGDYFGISYVGSFTIDSAARTITDLNGNTLLGLIRDGSSWPEYGPGQHRLRLAHGDPYSLATAELTWQDKWV
ncbi:hypothetical protein ACIBKZ_15590 [Streptomyces sp. NPDC050421]|uniref:hypothetical protein n=1 Tax=Streptomyces sp. NPDC050421 TaxID=3365613 RepID=UPI00379D71B2